MMWIIVFVVILFIAFITFKKANHHNECNDKKDETLSPQIDLKALESKIPLNNPPINDTHKFAQKNAKEITTSNNNDDIVWTAELMRIKSIMFLTPKHRHKTHSSATISHQKHKERYESLNAFEQYELALIFAEFIEEADNLHKAKMFAEERGYCLNAIKWCAKEGVSVIYWQSRLNQVNEILGIKPIEIDGISNKNTEKKYRSASNKYELFKSFTEQFETEYQHHHSNKNITEEQRVVNNAIKWAKSNDLIYLAQKWEKRIIKIPDEDNSNIEQKLKEKKRQLRTNIITSNKKTRRPRIKYKPKDISE